MKDITNKRQTVSYVGTALLLRLEEKKLITELFRDVSSNVEFACEFLDNARIMYPKHDFWRCFQGVVMLELAKAVWENRFWYMREKYKDEEYFEASIKDQTKNGRIRALYLKLNE